MAAPKVVPPAYEAAAEILRQVLVEGADKIKAAFDTKPAAADAGGGGFSTALMGLVAPLTGGITKAVGGLVGGMGNVLTAKLGSVLGPLAIFAQVIGSAGSGFQVLMTAVKLLAATLAPILLPVFAVIAAALVELSDKIWADLLPHLESWYTYIIENLLPALRQFFDAVMAVVKFVGGAVEAGEVVADAAQDAADFFQGGLDGVADFFGFGDDEEPAPAENPNPTGAGVYTYSSGAGGDFGGGGRGWLDGALTNPTVGGVMAGSSPDAGKPDALTDVVRSLRMSIGPRAQFSGLSQVSKNLQTAALNQDPLEARMLEKMTKSLDVLERVERNTRATRGGLV